MIPSEHTYGETLLKIDNVSLSLGGKQILREVNAEVKDVRRPGITQGQVVALLGPSGMGKTRLFRIIAGLDRPDSGRVTLDAQTDEVQRGSVGVVAQDYPLFEHRTVLSNLIVAGKQSRLSGGQAATRAKEFLENFGLEEHASKYPVQLSGGQRQRVAIAQQFMCSEDLLLMDEPFSGLDLNAIERVCDLVREVAASAENKTIIIVTHDVVAALEVADQVWILGRDRDEKGEPIPGARIQANYNLADMGLAWCKGISTSPECVDLIQQIRALYPKL